MNTTYEHAHEHDDEEIVVATEQSEQKEEIPTTDEFINELKQRIVSTVEKVSRGELTPPKCGIGKLLSAIRRHDTPFYNTYLELYKPLATKYFVEHPKDLKANSPAKMKEKERAANMKIGGGGGKGRDISEISDDELFKSLGEDGDAEPAFMKGKAKKKEKKVRVPKNPGEKGSRDRSELSFDGETYGKGKFVLAVIRAHVVKNPNITLEQLKKTFPDDLLKGYGIFQTREKAIEISKKSKRFFLKDDQLVRIKGASVAICNQFSTENIKPFLAHIRGMGVQYT